MIVDSLMTSLLMTSLFQVLAAVTGNAQSLIVESRVSGMTSAEVNDECRCYRQVHVSKTFIKKSRDRVATLTLERHWTELF